MYIYPVQLIARKKYKELILELVIYRDASEFLDKAGPFLLQDEGVHHLTLGVALNILNRNLASGSKPFFAAAKTGNLIQAAFIQGFPFPLVSTDATREILDMVCGHLKNHEYRPDGIIAPKATAAAFAAKWSALAGVKYEKVMDHIVYQLTKVNRIDFSPGHLRKARLDEIALIAKWTQGFYDDAIPGSMQHVNAEKRAENFVKKERIFIWEDGEPVSLVAWAGPSPNGVRINTVYTPPEFRNKGYSTACVAVLCSRILSEGKKYCFLRSDASVPASNRVYLKVGFEPVDESTEYKFVE